MASGKKVKRGAIMSKVQGKKFQDLNFKTLGRKKVEEEIQIKKGVTMFKLLKLEEKHI